MPADVIYDDTMYVKRNTYVSSILFIKFISTFPFNLSGVYKPEILINLPWILYNEAFHHYHSRIFYLLALHRNVTQLYCSLYCNGFIQKKFLFLEALFDIGLIVLYCHEYFRYHNINVFISAYSIIHALIALFSFHSLMIANKIKIKNVA